MSGAWLVLLLALWAVTIALTILALGLSRRIELLESDASVQGGRQTSAGARGQRVERLLGKDFGTPAVDFGLTSSVGGMAGVVLFVSEHCGPCQQLAVELSSEFDVSDQRGLADSLGICVTIVTDQVGAYDRLGATAVLIDADGRIRDGFEVKVTPTGIAIDDSGVVQDAVVANRLSHLRSLAQTLKSGEMQAPMPA